MAHNIMGEKSFVSNNGVPAWHHLGTVLNDDTLTATAALPIADMAWGINKVPVTAKLGNTRIEIPNTFALIRNPTQEDDNHVVFGTVSEGYQFLQNDQVANIVDSMLANSRWRLETIGALGNGDTIFFTVKAASATIAKEDVDLYFVITDNRNGKAAMNIMATPVRVVCQNTLSIAMRGKNRISIQHSGDINAEMQWRVDAVKRAEQQGQGIITAMQGLAKIKITEKKLDKIMAALFKLPSAPASLDLIGSGIETLEAKAETAKYQYENTLKGVDKAKVQILANYERLNDQYPTIAGTGWALYNGVTEYSTHQAGKSNLVRAREDVFGKGLELRTRAVELIMQP